MADRSSTRGTPGPGRWYRARRSRRRRKATTWCGRWLNASKPETRPGAMRSIPWSWQRSPPSRPIVAEVARAATDRCRSRAAQPSYLGGWSRKGVSVPCWTGAFPTCSLRRRNPRDFYMGCYASRQLTQSGAVVLVKTIPIQLPAGPRAVLCRVQSGRIEPRSLEVPACASDLLRAAYTVVGCATAAFVIGSVLHVRWPV